MRGVSIFYKTWTSETRWSKNMARERTKDFSLEWTIQHIFEKIFFALCNSGPVYLEEGNRNVCFSIKHVKY